MFLCSRIIERCAAKVLSYQVDTSPGQSGSPNCLRRGAQGFVAAGIHTRGPDDQSCRLTMGVRITREIADRLTSLIQAVEGGPPMDG
ncbi:uncharacterized protein SOCE26_024160 [Sorangium cellulosum]|uniref:Serine protease n=1 Tax=Sorangium cellulosum TaxID=56 RepID=A0A2L0EP32_SORCE|nr:uncharacterized protein SOCE26_024160 [Sorangium cellulosum]